VAHATYEPQSLRNGCERAPNLGNSVINEAV
jgi:hypothetical protein